MAGKAVPADLTAVIKTDKGDIRAELFPQDAPITVMNFVNLAQRGYYDGLVFHRVINEFMIQGGDPTGTGSGGPGYQFEDEFTPSRRHDGPGTLSMANSGPATNGSQFFVTHVATEWLDGKHTVFAKVVAGQDIVDSIAQGDKITRVDVEGDASALFEANQAQLDDWNATLDKKFPSKR
jgi:peptidyl-prolyl cis-trans isomerase B (cyclophilin B)